MAVYSQCNKVRLYFAHFVLETNTRKMDGDQLKKLLITLSTAFSLITAWQLTIEKFLEDERVHYYFTSFWII